MVQAGAVVTKDQPLIKMESMKMLVRVAAAAPPADALQQILRAPRDGVVARINFNKGEFVGEAAVVIEMQALA